MRNKIAENWFVTHKLIPEQGEHHDWGIKVSASTVPLTNWIANKSKISDSELWLSMSLHREFDSKVHLMSKDERFRVDWRNDYLPDVTSDSFLHRKRTVWPDFNAPDDFTKLVVKLENILKVKFDRNFEVHAYSLDMTRS